MQPFGSSQKVVTLLVLGALSGGCQSLSESGTSPLAPAKATDSIPDSELYYLVEGSVYDGDTLRVRRCDEQCEELKIRLCGIDAPEKDQQLGVESRDHLRSLIDQGFEDGRLIDRTPRRTRPVWPDSGRNLCATGEHPGRYPPHLANGHGWLCLPL